ncbi:hypothetical protein B0T25DRAFT_528339 [Lasiosphaeria hispida]|uniref:Uncharacterized protein n=1 Tax=Lasiosphaeria hispida TaxID=260671 RepID=A0AAJ0MKE5_9PEZI|nr:hypothetical protein B0T25DRAFT_528339 [Lasiosphaeria hispida]
MTDDRTITQAVRATNAGVRGISALESETEYPSPPPYSAVCSRDTMGVVPLDWRKVLDDYFHELDVLREDWASEVLGRYMQHAADTRRLGTLASLQAIIAGEVSTRSCRHMWIRRRMHTSEHWCLSRSWGSLQTTYKKRKQAIDKKYTRILGISPFHMYLADGRYDKKRLFPGCLYDICSAWPGFYPGQKVLLVKNNLVTWPPEHNRFSNEIQVKGRDGKVLFEGTMTCNGGKNISWRCQQYQDSGRH